jgi:hypothetical protein
MTTPATQDSVLEGDANYSRITLYTLRAPADSTANHFNTLHDQVIDNVRRALNLPTLSPTQQILLNRVIRSFLTLRETIQSRLLQHAQGDLSPHNARPIYDLPSLNNEIAIRQHTLVDPVPLIRYSNAYDDLLGSRSSDDGTAAAYAERDGDDAAYAIRFSNTHHNGLGFQQGHLHITTEDRNLVEARQARSLAGLTTQDMDEEIAYRMQRDSDSWGTSMNELCRRYTNR